MPTWTHGLQPAPSAWIPRIAPARRRRKRWEPRPVLAIPCKPLGHAAITRARIFIGYGQGESRRRSHKLWSSWTRVCKVWLVCCMVNCRWAPKFRPPWATHTITHSPTHPPTHSLTHLLTYSFTHLYMRIHTHIHKNLPTITPLSLLYFLFPSCFSMLNLSLEKLITCGVIRSYSPIIWCLLGVQGFDPLPYIILNFSSEMERIWGII